MLLVKLSIAQTYISIAPALTNVAGTIAFKSNESIEIGRQWEVFSLGLDYGRSTLTKIVGRDTANYVEIRPNLNIFQVGKYTNTFTAGIGYVFNAHQNLMTELTYGIEYTYTEQIHFNVQFGQYYYSGIKFASNESFFGVSIMYFFKPYKNGAIINK